MVLKHLTYLTYIMVWFLFTSQMRERAISVPPVTSEISESNLNRYVRDFLQGLVDNSIVVRIQLEY